MPHCVRIATIQPPAPSEGFNAQKIQDAGVALFDQAVAERPDIVCLPEYFNCMNHAPDLGEDRFGAVADALLETMARRAEKNACHVVLPMVVERDGVRYNRAHLLDRGGRLVGHFDKVHVTPVEQEQFGIQAGDHWPVFDLDFGRIGIMICYDGCFLESSRILALAGAEIIFWPSLQRSYTQDQLDLQTRAHAYFSYTTVVRSSYGGSSKTPPAPGNMVGLSCVCGPDGRMLTSIEGREGWTSAVVNLKEGPWGVRTFGGEVGLLREMRMEDRRPQTYGLLVETDGHVPAAGHPLPPPHAMPAATGKTLSSPTDSE